MRTFVCQHCRTRIPNETAMNPLCCRTPEISYHDTGRGPRISFQRLNTGTSNSTAKSAPSRGARADSSQP